MKNFGLIRTIFEGALIIIILVLIFHSFYPARVPTVGKLWYENVVQRVSMTEKLVALTYDDGPHPVYTPQILKVLDQYHVKATFFMIGEQMKKYPGLVKEVLRKGHIIANHTYHHPQNIEVDSPAQIMKELELCEHIIEHLTGRRSKFFRPPHGLVNGTVLSIAQKEGYRTILWTVCADHHDAPTPQLMAQRVIDQIQPGGIILAHDGTFESRWKDVQATSLIIKSLEKQGYRFVTIPELLRKAEKSH